MADDTNRKKIAFYLGEDAVKELDRIKQVKFYDKSYAELYRYIVGLGITAAKERA